MSKISISTYPENIKQQILEKIKNLDKLSPEEKKFWLDEYQIMQQWDWVEVIEYSQEEIKNLTLWKMKQNKRQSQSTLTTIRIPNNLLQKIKKEAKKLWMPYQTLIKSILHQHFDKS